MQRILKKLPGSSRFRIYLIVVALIGCDQRNEPPPAPNFPSRITITPASITLAKGEMANLVATAAYADGTSADITHGVEWKSSEPAAAIVDSTGELKGISTGTTTITATLNEITSSPTQVKVGAAILSGITVSSTTGTITQDETVTFTAIATYSDSSTANISNRVTWDSDHDAVAVIDTNGVATGISAGSSLITARLGKTVSNATPLTVAFSIGGTLSGLAPGNSIVLANKEADKIELTANGLFSFPARLKTGSAYDLSIVFPPTKQPCTHTYGAGKVQREKTPSLSVICGFPPRGETVKTASLASARRDHTATSLPNGKVLATGGVGASDNLASAELYDPISESWSATGTLALARRSHTATLLPNGKVLVAGGMNSAFARLGSAELYDTDMARWTATGGLSTARSQHTATLLANGKVLVTGGVGALGAGTLASAELYDPKTGYWTATGSLATARSQHTAMLLPNGKVLVSGGVGSASAGMLASAEVYDPATGRWASTGSLMTARSQHTSTLLPNGQVLVAGGIGTTDSLASAELYTPANGHWTATGSLASKRYLHTAILLPTGKVLVTGGVGMASAETLGSAELFDPVNGQWTATGGLAAPRSQHTATLLSNGKMLVTGGNGSGVLATTELYW